MTLLSLGFEPLVSSLEQFVRIAAIFEKYYGVKVDPTEEGIRAFLEAQEKAQTLEEKVKKKVNIEIF